MGFPIHIRHIGLAGCLSYLIPQMFISFSAVYFSLWGRGRGGIWVTKCVFALVNEVLLKESGETVKLLFLFYNLCDFPLGKVTNYLYVEKTLILKRIFTATTDRSVWSFDFFFLMSKP